MAIVEHALFKFMNFLSEIFLRASKYVGLNAASPVFTAHYLDEQLPNLEEATKEFKGKDGINILEIGSYEGKASLWFYHSILTGKNCSITTVDKFRSSAFWNNTVAERRSGKMKALTGYSFDVLTKLYLSGVRFDFIYIDGSHFSRNVMEDAVVAWRLLNENGVMLFDDYLWEDIEYFNSLFKVKYEEIRRKYDFSCGNPFTPKAAVDSFLSAYNLDYELVFSNYQLAVRKTSNKLLGDVGFNLID